jgi:hypothetical protein
LGFATAIGGKFRRALPLRKWALTYSLALRKWLQDTRFGEEAAAAIYKEQLFPAGLTAFPISHRLLLVSREKNPNLSKHLNFFSVGVNQTRNRLGSICEAYSTTTIPAIGTEFFVALFDLI